MNVIINRHITIAMINGMTATAVLSILTLPTLEATKRLTPSGGVTKPIARETTRMIPKWTGSIPTATTTGSRIGVNTTNAEIVSINMPITKRNRRIIRINLQKPHNLVSSFS